MTNAKTEFNSAGDLIVKRMESIKPMPEERRRELDELDRQRRISELRNDWNAPKRQSLRDNLDRSGPWGETEQKLRAAFGKGFIIALAGTRGPGKTQLGVELMKFATTKLKSTKYCSAADFFMDIKASYRKDEGDAEKDVIHHYRKPFLLVIDEMAKRGETEWEDRLLFDLIDKRYQDLKDTLLIANQTKEEFLQSLGPSLASRMSETGGIIECNWKSYR